VDASRSWLSDVGHSTNVDLAIFLNNFSFFNFLLIFSFSFRFSFSFFFYLFFFFLYSSFLSPQWWVSSGKIAALAQGDGQAASSKATDEATSPRFRRSYLAHVLGSTNTF